MVTARWVGVKLLHRRQGGVACAFWLLRGSLLCPSLWSSSSSIIPTYTTNCLTTHLTTLGSVSIRAIEAMAWSSALLFDKPEYSDIIVSYSDRRTFCHKIILCTSSDYFKKLCGPGSQFGVSLRINTTRRKEADLWARRNQIKR